MSLTQTSNEMPPRKRHRPHMDRPVSSAAMIIILLSPPACSRTETSQPTPMVQMAPLSFTDLADASSPAVVNIRTVKTLKSGGRVYRHFFGGPNRPNDPFQDFFENFSMIKTPASSARTASAPDLFLTPKATSSPTTM
jgi:S1-C subfamily serine protease